MDKYLQLISFLGFDHPDVNAFVPKIIQELSGRFGHPQMEYLKSRGTFADLPSEQIRETYRNEYKEDMLKILLSEDVPRKRKAAEAEQQKNQ